MTIFNSYVKLPEGTWMFISQNVDFFWVVTQPASRVTTGSQLDQLDPRIRDKWLPACTLFSVEGHHANLVKASDFDIFRQRPWLGAIDTGGHFPNFLATMVGKL